MPSVTFDGQSFFVKGRRAWLVGAGFEYALCEPDSWGDRLDQLRRAGANTVVASAPWCVHEPRQGRFRFEGEADLARFLDLCAERQLWVVLRIGPAIGEPFDGSGIPSWVLESGPARLREFDPAFLERTSAIYRQVLSKVSGRQATDTLAAGRRQVGPVVAIQIEHRWFCANDEQADRYLAELVRFARECGASVPLLTANGMWQPIEGAIDCWEGCDSMLANLRQLRELQEQRPRVAFIRDPRAVSVWGGDPKQESAALADLPRHVAATLASGAMPLVCDAVGGTHRQRTSGRQAPADGAAGGFIATVEPRGVLVDAFGAFRPESAALRRLMLFASSFGHVFADAEADRQPIAADPDPVPPGRGGRKNGTPASVVGVRGPGGQVVFAFAPDAKDRRMNLVLEDGRTLPVDLGESEFAWFAKDIDLRGQGRLDYATLPVLCMLRRKMLVFFGPAGAEGTISIGGAALDVKVPTNSQPPLVAEHRGLVVVVLNEAQSLAAVADGGTLRIGVESRLEDGSFRLAKGFKESFAIELDGSVSKDRASGATSRATPVRWGEWQQWSDPSLSEGTSPRFATIDGPASLRTCGVAAGYGWYRVGFRQSKAGRIRLDLPHAGDRLRMHLDGTLLGVVGEGPGATSPPIEVKVSAGEHRLAVLAEHLGRGSDGLGPERRTGLWRPIAETAPLKGTKIEMGPVAPVDPFPLRGFLPGVVRGTPAPEEGVRIEWSHRRKTRLLLDLGSWPCPSTVFLNGAVFARIDGDASRRTVLELPTEGAVSTRAGSNEIVIVPDEEHPLSDRSIVKRIRLEEVVRELGGDGAWAFARWYSAPEVCEQPGWVAADGSRKAASGLPTWFRCTIRTSEKSLGAAGLVLDLSSMGKGEAFLDGEPLGRYFARTPDGKVCGPSDLPVPRAKFRPGEEQVLAIFDEDGRSPTGIRMTAG